jgi:hypothetical protein
MAYINAQDVKAIRNELKETFKKFKFSVKKSHSSSVIVTIKSGPVDFSDIVDERGYAQINQYWLERTGQHKPMFEKVVDIIKTAPIRGEGYRKGSGWYDNSDSMTDYFDTAYYFSINVGDYYAPYECTTK